MPHTNNVSNLSNQELFASKKASMRVDRVTLKIAGKTIAFDGIEAFVRKGPEGVLFLSVPTIHAIVKGGRPISTPSDVKAALRSFRQKTTPSTPNSVELPEELRKQLEAFSKANNARVIVDSQGNYKVQKIRGKRK